MFVYFVQSLLHFYLFCLAIVCALNVETVAVLVPGNVALVIVLGILVPEFVGVLVHGTVVE